MASHKLVKGRIHRKAIAGINSLERRPVTWMAVLAGLLLIGLSLPRLYRLYVEQRWPITETPHRSAFDFLTLVYNGGAGEEQHAHVAVERFRNHLAMLQQAGHHFIGLQDVQSLLRDGVPLPPRAVLLTVEIPGTSRNRNEWLAAVVQSNARAVLFVNTEDDNRPRWLTLRRTAALPHWEVAVAYEVLAPAARFTNATESVNGDHQAVAHHFGRLHDLDQAAAQRHRRFRANMRRPFPTPVMALAYPSRPTDACGANGYDIRCHVLIENAKRFFDLGFITGELALNTRRSDPMRLNRLRVPPHWTGRELVERLQAIKSLPFETADRFGVAERAPWIPVFGMASVTNRNVALRAVPPAVTGLWLGGSDRNAAFVADLTFVLHHGTLRIPFLADPDESRHWELRLDTHGDIALSQRIDRYDRQVANDRWSVSGHPVTLRIIQRRDQLWITLNESPLFNGWIAMNEPTVPGLLGLRIAGLDTQPAEAEIISVKIAPQETTIAWWDGVRGNDHQRLAWMGNHAADLTAVSPPLRHIRPLDQASTGLLPAQRLFRAATRIHGWDLIPHLTLRDDREIDSVTPERLAAHVAGLDASGLLVRLEGSGRGTVTQPVAQWLRSTAMALQEKGLRLLVRLPATASDRLTVRATLGRIPGVQWVADASVPPQERRDAALEITVPEPDAETDLRLYYDLLAGSRDRVADRQRGQIQEWRELAEERFATGEHEDAIAIWFDWHEADPGNSFPLQRIGEALQRLGYRDEATEFYRLALDRDPGNVELAVQLAGLIDSAARHDEAWDILNVYSLLFPGNTTLLLAQAEWLARRGRPDEGLLRIRRLMAIEPDNLSALLLQTQWAVTAEERRLAIDRLVRLGDLAENRYRTLQMVRDTNLLGLPEAESLLTLLELPVPVGDRKLADLIEELTPRANSVMDVAGPQSDISSGWLLEGGTFVSDHARFRVRSDAGREEVMLRLSGTERWRDFYVEVDIARQTGEFWIVARRSRDHMVRFGFDSGGDQLHLQVWGPQNDIFTMLSHSTRSWSMPLESGVRLRLEIRGNGAMGFINGEPWGQHALALPVDLPPGWLSVVSRSIDPGQAEMVLRSIAAGPIYPVMVFSDLEELPGNMDRKAADLRRLAMVINGISQPGFSISQDGVWASKPQPHDAFYRLFARYHGLRLMPLVEVQSVAAVSAANILKAVDVHGVDGFVLELAQPPSRMLIEKLNRELAGRNVDLILMFVQDGTRVMTGCGRSRLLFPGGTEERRITTFRVDAYEQHALHDARRLGPVVIRW